MDKSNVFYDWYFIGDGNFNVHHVGTSELTSKEVTKLREAGLLFDDEAAACAMRNKIVSLIENEKRRQVIEKGIERIESGVACLENRISDVNGRLSFVKDDVETISRLSHTLKTLSDKIYDIVNPDEE